MALKKREIEFGTDGWRGIIGGDFTFLNIRKLSFALARYLGTLGKKDRPVVIGYDNRFLSEKFALESARALIHQGVTAVVSSTSVPTPALSLRVVETCASAGIMITASHNPPEFNGLKLKAESGNSALPATTDAIQALASEIKDQPCASILDDSSVPRDDFISPYTRNLKRYVDVQLIGKSAKALCVDSMHGTGGRIIERLLSGRKARVRTINADADPCFGGINPEPLAKNLSLLARTVRRDGFDLGIATDGDADRVAAVSENGSYLSPLTITPLLALHLIENRKMTGAIVKTYANTVYLDRIARAYSLPFFIRPIGFKYIAEIMLKGDFLIGGEESGGIGIGGYIPERDGILASLLLLEMLCVEGISMTELKRDLWRRFGRFEYRREDIASRPEVGIELTRSLLKDPPDRIADSPIERIDDLDGIKFILRDGSWLLLRQSGTEPVLRIYAEASSKKKLDRLIGEGISISKKRLA